MRWTWRRKELPRRASCAGSRLTGAAAGIIRFRFDDADGDAARDDAGCLRFARRRARGRCSASAASTRSHSAASQRAVAIPTPHSAAIPAAVTILASLRSFRLRLHLVIVDVLILLVFLVARLQIIRFDGEDSSGIPAPDVLRNHGVALAQRQKERDVERARQHVRLRCRCTAVAVATAARTTPRDATSTTLPTGSSGATAIFVRTAAVVAVATAAAAAAALLVDHRFNPRSSCRATSANEGIHINRAAVALRFARQPLALLFLGELVRGVTKRKDAAQRLDPLDCDRRSSLSCISRRSCR